MGMKLPHRTIGPHEPVAEFEGFAITEGLPNDAPDAFAIGRMHPLHEGLVGCAEFSWLEAVQSIQLVRPSHSIGDNVPLPSRHGRERGWVGIAAI